MKACSQWAMDNEYFLRGYGYTNVTANCSGVSVPYVWGWVVGTVEAS